jgi:general secretion pathway protein B
LSFILEALRKSESDRQRLGSVALADLPVARRRSGQPWWVFALGALLLVNLVVLAVVLTRDKPVPAPAGATTPIHVAPSNAVRSNTQVAPPAQQTATTPTIPNGNNSLEAATAHIQYEPVPAIEAEIAHAAASMPDGQTLVRPMDGESKQPNPIPATAIPETRGSPELHIDLHVYSNNVRERFVLINMRRYTEGQQLPNGATVEQITPQGVIVYQNGSRYQIDRQ